MRKQNAVFDQFCPHLRSSADRERSDVIGCWFLPATRHAPLITGF